MYSAADIHVGLEILPFSNVERERERDRDRDRDRDRETDRQRETDRERERERERDCGEWERLFVGWLLNVPATS